MEDQTPEFTSYEHGCPCWIDLMSPDVDGAKAFHASVFGWESTDQLDDDGNRIYVMFTSGGTIVQEPFDVPGVGTMAVAHDPAGGSFSLMQPQNAS